MLSALVLCLLAVVAQGGGESVHRVDSVDRDADLDCGGSLSTCLGCYRRLQCVQLEGAYQPVQVSDCPADSPYCAQGSCGATPADSSCVRPEPSSGFACGGDGYYPDPANCRSYWMCVQGSAYQYQCDSSNVYSHPRAMCVASSEAKCVTASCSAATVGAYQHYPPSPEVFFVCQDSDPANALVAACPSNHTANATTGHCELTCLDEGRLPDEDNAAGYYECERAGKDGKQLSAPMHAFCPQGSTFNAVRQRCLTGHEGESSEEKAYHEDYYVPDTSIPESTYNVPESVKIGAATAAYQIEGAWNVSDKTPSTQDVFYHSRPNLANADIAARSYSKYKEDVALLKELKMQFYRFSISWTRLLPQGHSGSPSVDGLNYYNNLINALIGAGVEPVVTLYHWDLPQKYQDDGGMLNPAFQDRYADYARFCFGMFGDRVKTWILMNEPLSQCLGGYEVGVIAPGVFQPGTGAYLCNHNMLLAHAKAYRVYQASFKSQGGKLGSAPNLLFGQPKTGRQEDVDAAQRFMEWQYAWFMDPLVTGDYPPQMRKMVDELSKAEGRAESRLPTFTEEEKAILKGAYDFFGINNYSSSKVTSVHGNETVLGPGYLTDTQTLVSVDPQWHPTNRYTSPVTPWGLAGSLKWIKQRYNNPPVWITENGYCGVIEDGLEDIKRIGYHSGYMRGVMRAINEDNCNVIGYTVWSLLDNFEWSDGYKLKYGLVAVDFNADDRPRTIKDSGRFLASVIQSRYVPYQPVV